MRIPYKSKTVVSPTYVTNSGSRKKPTLRPGSLLTHWNLFNGLEHKVKGFDIRRLLSLFRMEYPTISLLHPLTFYRSYQRPYFISIYDRQLTVVIAGGPLCNRLNFCIRDPFFYCFNMKLLGIKIILPYIWYLL